MLYRLDTQSSCSDGCACNYGGHEHGDWMEGALFGDEVGRGSGDGGSGPGDQPLAHGLHGMQDGAQSMLSVVAVVAAATPRPSA